MGVHYNIQVAVFSPAAAANVLQGPGTFFVEFTNGTSGGQVLPGNLHLLSGTAMLTNNFSLPAFGLMFTGAQFDTFVSGMGAVTAGGMFSLPTVGHIVTGMIHCTGGLCGLAGFPASVPVNLTSGTRPFNLLAGLINGFTMGPQSFSAMGTGGMTPQGGVFAVTVTGTEVGRVLVPEPGTGLLVGLGLTGLGIAATSWRVRRRS